MLSENRRDPRCIFFCIKTMWVMWMLLMSSSTISSGEYLSTDKFLEQAFGLVPQAERYWLTEDVKKQAEMIVGHRIPLVRMRYWRLNGKTAWVLDEIGKERPITIGVVVSDNKIESVAILQFRESRGWEVRYESFTSQFQQAEIAANRRLTKNIDGITGATLSVAAVKRSAELALYLHGVIMNNDLATLTTSHNYND